MKKSFLKKALSAAIAMAMTISSFAAIAIPATADEAQGEPMRPEGAIDVINQPTNKWGKQEVTVASDGTKRDTAKMTANDEIYYLGDFDLNDIAKIEVRAGMVTNTKTDPETYPQLKFAYMPVSAGDDMTADTGYGTDGDKAYIAANSGTIRAGSNIVAKIVAKTEPASASGDGHLYLGALFTITTSGVTVDGDGYAAYPGGTVTLDETQSSALSTAKGGTNVHLFAYGTASNCRISLDYVKITSKYTKVDLSKASMMKLTAANQASVTNGAELSYTPNSGIENKASDIKNLTDNSTETKIVPGKNATYVLDFGKDIPIGKLVVRSMLSKNGIVYGLVKSDEFSGTAASLKSNNWFRANGSADNANGSTVKLLADNYSVTRSGTDGDSAYFTLSTSGEPAEYRYVIVSDMNNGGTTCYDMEVYSTEELTVSPVTVTTAEGIKTGYDTFSDAVDAVNAGADGSVITLNENASTAGFKDIKKNDVTIEGGNHTLTMQSGTWDYLELASSANKLTLNNLNIEGNKLNIPGSAQIFTDNCNIAALNLGGAGTASKGTLKNSTIGAITTYGKISLENTTVTNVEFTNINNGSDQPSIEGDAKSKVTGTVSFGSGVSAANVSFPYSLFSGNMTKPTVILPETFAGYVCADGIIDEVAGDPHTITTSQSDDITLSNTEARKGEIITVTGAKIAQGSVVVKAVEEGAASASVSVTKNADGSHSFAMPNANVEVSALINTNEKFYVVADSVSRKNAQGSSDSNNYYIKPNQALAMTFTVPTVSVPENKTLASVKLRFARSNTAGGQLTNIYDQTDKSGFEYENGSGYIGQYTPTAVDGGVSEAKLDTTPNTGTYKLLLSYDSSVAENASGNDYYVVGATNASKNPRNASELPCIVYTFKEAPPAKKAPKYELQTDTEDDMFQYHFAGGTDEFMDGTSAEGKAYDVYLWVPPQTSPGELKGLVAVKMNLIEVPFVQSAMLREALAEKDFGILFLVCQKDSYGYNNTLNGFYTRKDYKGDDTIYANDTDKWTTDGKSKDAAEIMDEILAGIADASGYSEIKTTVPLITMGHSAASGFGNKSANWNKDRVIAQVHMKNGMSGGEAMVPGVPQLQYAAQYTEHAMNTDRDRSVLDARYHITDKRAKDTSYLVSHIIEWGSGHYDWSENATYMLTRYITKAIEARLPANYSETKTLNDLTNTGYIMKPFEKDENGNEQEEGYYRDYLQGWLSSGQSNATASEADKKASFWFFDEEFANEVNEFTNYAIPESPDTKRTNVGGKTYSDNEPFMLMKNPSASTYATTPASALNQISPYLTFANNPFSRYGGNRFVNYTRMASPNANASNTANLGGYDTVTVDTYYMNKIPSIISNGSVAYDGAGKEAVYPENQKAEFVPLMAPYEVVGSELIDMADMTVDTSNSEAANVASVTRTTLRFHNNRIYYRSGNASTSGTGTAQDSYGFIKSPEVRAANGFVTSPFKATSSQVTVPYVTKGTAQTLTLDEIADVNVSGTASNPKFSVSYTSSDEELQKYTDVFVEYGPAKAVRTTHEDGSYSWEIEILKDQIPENAVYPIEVNVVASNLGKWENVYGATTSQTFNITSSDVTETPGPSTDPTTPPTTDPTTPPTTDPTTPPTTDPTTPPTTDPTTPPITDPTTEPEIVIGDIDNSDEDKTTTVVTVENPNEATEAGALVAAVYDEEGNLIQVKFVTDGDGTVEFRKTTAGYIKAFLWDSIDEMKAILKAQRKLIN